MIVVAPRVAEDIGSCRFVDRFRPAIAGIPEDVGATAGALALRPGIVKALVIAGNGAPRLVDVDGRGVVLLAPKEGQRLGRLRFRNGRLKIDRVIGCGARMQVPLFAGRMCPALHRLRPLAFGAIGRSVGLRRHFQGRRVDVVVDRVGIGHVFARGKDEADHPARVGRIGNIEAVAENSVGLGFDIDGDEIALVAIDGFAFGHRGAIGLVPGGDLCGPRSGTRVRDNDLNGHDTCLPNGSAANRTPSLNSRNGRSAGGDRGARSF